MSRLIKFEASSQIYYSVDIVVDREAAVHCPAEFLICDSFWNSAAQINIESRCSYYTTIKCKPT